MDVHIQSREGGEQLGSAVLLAAFDDLMVSEYLLDPGTEPGDPHYHANHSDSFYALEGELEFQIDGRIVRASPGTLVVAPRGAVHAFPSR
jgi:quercetin dioxygenase-like cupin family protein